jgi:hypothetical protein
MKLCQRVKWTKTFRRWKKKKLKKRILKYKLMVPDEEITKFNINSKDPLTIQNQLNDESLQLSK